MDDLFHGVSVLCLNHLSTVFFSQVYSEHPREYNLHTYRDNEKHTQHTHLIFKTIWHVIVTKFSSCRICSTNFIPEAITDKRTKCLNFCDYIMPV